jgi:hypothetical protein
MNTGVKIDGKTVYFTKGLKNPLSGFFFKTTGGKKNKVLMKNVANEKSKSALSNVLKKHSNVVTPPAGKVLNPLTGRFVKAPGAKKEKKVAKKSPTPTRNSNSNNNNYDAEYRRSRNLWLDMEGKTGEDDVQLNSIGELDELFLSGHGMMEYMEEVARVEEMTVNITIKGYTGVKIILKLEAHFSGGMLGYSCKNAVVIKNGIKHEMKHCDDIITFLKEKSPSPKRSPTPKRSPGRNDNMPNLNNNGRIVMR